MRDRSLLLLSIACEGEEAPHDVRDPVSLLQDPAGDIAFRAVAERLVAQDLGVVDDPVDRIVDLVGHPGGKLSDGRQVGGPHRLGLQDDLSVMSDATSMTPSIAPLFPYRPGPSVMSQCLPSGEVIRALSARPD